MPGFLLDLDGTLYNGDRPIPYAAEFISWLRERGYPYLYVTNNSSRSPEQVASHLAATGIDASPSEVLTSSQASAMYMKDAGLDRGSVMCIGETGLREALTEAGFRLVGEEEAEHGVAAVVQGIDRTFSYEKLLKAVRYIRAGAQYVLTNPDHLLPWNGELTPGAGSIAASIERASEKPPVIIGKPSPIIMRYAVAKLGLPPQEIWAVGDNMNTDIRGGADANCRTALVLTGLANESNVEEQIAKAGVRPELVCRHLMELAERLG
ncbi:MULTISPECIES: HAD-IIA family hydrolase [unclassified Paenibacillus]|uniref:HAD-IIA family hydrolase n=1 Tax=unclassified Paenibacillus TaxID=185978 RepID=UPI001AE94A01|nr:MULTISPECIES: HAD-IIA family hydrolase [unclassified Paenibacillus]MBP1156718.1 4-nitrophenyl phosphatase [Paenibacillus sp. PvP091]MBP1172544.1 4-nitrophenyl phosphatase [Paenibacillus sp. PvR098]MBP2438924.1 4-nitrophenyl phosphatase [Paenibacillus sp. PvP052]